MKDEKLKLFDNIKLEYNQNGEPQLVSFREISNDIESTNYLTHSVYYYPAKFIPHVVRFCIENFTSVNDWIVDPFAGSGTVGLESFLHKRNSFLIDINYMLDHIIPVKIVKQKNYLDVKILEKKLDFVYKNDSRFEPGWSNLEYWYSSEILDFLKKLWSGQKKLENDLYSQIIQAALIKISKQYSFAEHRTPKLFKSKFKNHYIENLLIKDWKTNLMLDLKNVSIEILKNINQFIYYTKGIDNEVIHYGGNDSASFEFDDSISFDALITSPPYAQAQEYIRTFKLDLFWLGYSEQQVKTISNLEIPYRKADEIIHTTTLDTVKSQIKSKKLEALLDAYFCYTLRALKKSMNKLKKGGYACIFVGNPKVDGTEIETWRIFNEYFINIGYKMVAIFEDKIKNRQLFKSRNNKNPDGMNSEFLLILQKISL